MKIIKNKSLKELNTFGINVLAEQYISISKEEELQEVLRRIYASEIFILGGGSNMLLTKNIDKTVVHINLKGIEILEETDDYIDLKVAAGENWHQFVMFCVNHDYGGLENLSLIPGYVGTSPIQNIGAYGVELKDHFLSCRAIHRQTSDFKTFTAEDCEFGYRQSIFKNKLKDQYIITSVNFRLSKKNHKQTLDYGAIKETLASRAISSPTIKDISDAVITIRSSKLPNPNELGNSGSFFKNPVISAEKFKKLSEKESLRYYELPDGTFKIPAGWLIDQVGLKGYRDEDAGVHKNQALVLVNHGNATGEDILNLSKFVQSKVKERFNIELQPEVNIF
ncbi:UDP-N-acetylmuramate dehydrogenase [Psychroflexus halocasei]|uniref:UDP-N-acetylmuramate dehydrogenase n=1 Tax=Psychroflexus halocasei TaxID=908615 RepID=UPI000B88F90D|nr:UDP-N-acetylmuramate dehydrogenase [Psychroflexus halocasei]